MDELKPAKLRLIDETGNEAGEYTIPHASTATAPWARDIHRATWKHFDEYVGWRKTKCQPRDHGNPPEHMEDMNQAIHEFVGEVAEMSELVQVHGGDCFRFGENRMKLIGEIGDVFFTGSWVMDTWGFNVLLEVPGKEPSQFLYDSQVRDWERRRDQLAILLGKNTYDPAFWSHIYLSLCFMQSQAGLLCNSYKKLRYQGRQQRVSDQIHRVSMVLEHAAKLAILAGVTVEDCLENNVRKLDHRFPDGYQGPGGGNRTGVGA